MVSRMPIPNFRERGNGSNYPVLKIKIRSRMVARALWEITGGVETKPQDLRDALGRVVKAANPDDVRDWVLRDAEALSMITGTTVDSVLPHIQLAETTWEAWKILKDLYETNNTARIFTIQNQLFMMTMGEGESINDHLVKVKIQKNQLAAVGQKVDSNQLAMFVSKLPQKFNGLVTTLTAGE